MKLSPHKFNAQVLSYNYIYSLNVWLLLNPTWLCFDWSMGCVPLVESLADPRLLAVVAFWVTSGALGSYVLLGKPTEFRRFVHNGDSVLWQG